MNKKPQHGELLAGHKSLEKAGSRPTGHESHCFIVMPFGRDPAESRWFRGWYDVVIKPAVLETGYEPVLAAAEEQPGAINDEIRAHLAQDEMVVVDLGGMKPEDDPNPNVMYELGIRHALGLPLVLMAWKGQRLPFDVSNQRVIMEGREFVDLDQNKKKLVSFIKAARAGNYYRPMEAVSRLATIQAATSSLGEESILRALVEEVTALRSAITHLPAKGAETQKGETLIFTEFVTDPYWISLSRMSGKSLEDLFVLLRETKVLDDFWAGCFPTPDRRKVFLEAFRQSKEEDKLLERANSLRSQLGMSPYMSTREQNPASGDRQ